MKRFRLTEIQAQAILDMPLRRLAGLERRKIADEYQEKLREIQYLEGLLRSPTKIRKVIREDLLALKEKYGDARRTHIVDREMGHHTARELVEVEDVLVTLWQDGQLCRTATAPRVSSKAVPAAQVWGNTRDDVAFFAASGQAVMIPLHQVPADQDTPVSGLTGLDRSETLVSALVLPHPPEGEEPPKTYLTMVSQGGRIKRVTLEDFATASRGAVTAMKVEEGDRLAWVQETQGQDEILLVTRQGKAIRFSEEDVRPMGLSAAGVLAVKLGKDDAVVGMGTARTGSFAVIFSEQGYAKRTGIRSFPTQKRYGGGVQAAKLTSQTGRLAVAVVASERDDVVLTTAKGRVTKLPVKAIHSQGRATSGYKIRSDTKEPYVEPDKHGAPAVLTVLAGTKTAAKQARARRSARTGDKKSTAKKTTSKTTTTKTTSRTKAAASKAKTKTSSAEKTLASKKPVQSSQKASQPADAKSPASKDATAEQIPLPLTSAPSKKSTKTTTRKKKTVRSVPGS
jgi:DNA gyrase subunit A